MKEPENLMHDITFAKAAHVDFDDLVTAFNLAYSDYLVPLQLSPEQMRHTHEQTDIALSKSTAALVGNEIVGMGFLALRDHRAWIGGMGVIPEYRGRGIGRQLMKELLNEAQQNNVTAVQLEVIEKNVTAYSLYADMGFKPVRRLIVAVNEAPPTQKTQASVKSLTVEAALSKFKDFHQLPNPWQREYLSLIKAHDLQGWSTLSNGQVSSYIVGKITKHMIQIMDVAFAQNNRDDVRELLIDLHRQGSDLPASMVNIDEADPAWTVMQDLGYVERIAQIEMIYNFS